MDILGIFATFHLQNTGVARRVTREKRERHNSTYDADQKHRHGNKTEQLKALGLGLVFLDLFGTHAIITRLGPEKQKAGKKDKNNNKGPGIAAMDVNGRVEPPIGRRQNQEYENNQQNGRLAAKAGHAHPFKGVANLSCAIRATKTAKTSKAPEATTARRVA